MAEHTKLTTLRQFIKNISTMTKDNIHWAETNNTDGNTQEKILVDAEVDPVPKSSILHEINTRGTVKVLDRDGTDLGTFHMDHTKSILENAEDNNIDIWYSCRSGACFACGCHMISWKEHIDIGKFDIPLVDVEEEDCLTCIAWVEKGFDGEIVIKKF